MSSLMKGIKIAVLGGDDRELYLIPMLRMLGAEINVVGLPVQESERVKIFEDISEAVKGVKVIIFPMPGMDEQGQIRATYVKKPLLFTEEIIQRVPRDALIFIGKARLTLMKLTAKYGQRLIEIADIDEVAIPNSVPSAEGALQMAMEKSPLTIHGSNSMVIGFGRCGMTLARMLSAIGAKTSIVARNPVQLARAMEMGLQPLTYQELPAQAKKTDFIFNTVPAMVINSQVLASCNQEVLIIDIASAPGGVDYEAAKILGIKAELAPGLPGKVAPKTAGLILSQVIPNLIEHELSMRTSESKD